MCSFSEWPICYGWAVVFVHNECGRITGITRPKLRRALLSSRRWFGKDTSKSFEIYTANSTRSFWLIGWLFVWWWYGWRLTKGRSVWRFMIIHNGSGSLRAFAEPRGAYSLKALKIEREPEHWNARGNAAWSWCDFSKLIRRSSPVPCQLCFKYCPRFSSCRFDSLLSVKPKWTIYAHALQLTFAVLRS